METTANGAAGMSPVNGAAAPATPGTPAPLFAGPRVDSLSYDRKSMPRCKCLPVEAWAPSTHGCVVEIPAPDVSLTRKLGAEFVGTFILIFFATAAPIVNQKYGGAISPFGNAACAGLAVMIIILSTGHISGAHLNPSLTIAFAALRHFPWLQVPAYVAVQVLGSICAAFALKGVFHPFLSGGVTVPDPTISTAQAFFTEFIITFNLLFVVTAVATDTRAVGELAGIAVGAAVTLNILIAGSGGVGAGQADDGRVHEPGEDAWAGGGGGELPAAVDIPDSADAGRDRRRRRVHGGEAPRRERRDPAPPAQLPPLIQISKSIHK